MKIYIEAEYTNYSDFVNNWLLIKAQTGEEIFPGLKITKIDKFPIESKPFQQKSNKTIQKSEQTQIPKMNTWIEMNGNETGSIPMFSM